MSLYLKTHLNLEPANLFLIFIITFSSFITKAQTVDLWVSDFNGTQKLEPQNSLDLVSGDGSGDVVINIDPTVTYQSIDGFGAAMTGSSSYLINNTLSNTQKEALMDDLFTDAGIKLDLIRHTIGASDFNLSSYTYNDIPEGQTDPDLLQFSIGQDTINLVPVLQLAKSKNPDLKIMGSPWSAPAWMKEVHDLNGGWLDVAWYQTYADYLVKYVQAYEDRGLPIYAMTLQNEPLHNDTRYPSMRMDPGNQINFLKNDLGPAFSAANLDTKLVVYDHNLDNIQYPIDVLNDADARQFASGSAFHGYANGEMSGQTTVHNAHPDKDIWFTEISGGGWATNYGSNLRYYMDRIIIDATRNWSKGSIFWNIALDENSGPQNGGCSDCRGVVTINSNDGSITKNEEYYALGHVSKFVDSGAKRIESNIEGDILNVAFENPDGSIVMVAYNSGNQPSSDLVVRIDGKSFSYEFPRNTAITFKWNPESNENSNLSASFDEVINDFEVNFDASESSLSNGSIVSYEWDFGDETSGNGETVSHVYSEPGEYTVTLTITDNEDASDTISKSISIASEDGDPQETMFIQSVSTGTQNASRGNKYGVATVIIVDESDNPVENVSVNGNFQGSFDENVSGTTGSDGSVDFITSTTLKGGINVNFCIESLSHNTFIYDSYENDFSCSNSSSAKASLSEENNSKGQNTFLNYNYPNPFKSSTTIRFKLEDASNVNLEVYNLRGQKIKTLVSQMKSSGTHSVNFDGSGLKPGVYMYRIQAGESIQTGKMILMK